MRRGLRALSLGAKCAAVAAVFALASSALGGCAPPPPVSLQHGTRRYQASDYERVLERWTRSEDLIDLNGLDHRLSAAATFQSWDFRWAYAVRVAHDQRMSAEESARILEQGLQASQREHEFYIAITTSRVRWGDLPRRDTAWHVRLVDDRGREVTPARIGRDRRQTPTDIRYFPYTTPWRQVFRLYFPRRATGSDGAEYEVLGPGTRYFVLRFSGPLGALDLRWNVRDDAR